MKRAKLRHNNSTTTISNANGLIGANLIADILRMIVEYAWQPSAHLSLALTCKRFLSWILDDNYFLRRYMYNLDTLPQSKPNATPIGCVSLIRLVRKHSIALGEERVTLIQGKPTQEHALTPDQIGDKSLTPKDVLQAYIHGPTALDHNKDNSIYTLFDLEAGIPRDIYEPYPAWRLLSQNRDAWYSSCIVPESPCPQSYQQDVQRILATLPEGNKTKTDVYWYLLYCVVSISNEAAKYVYALASARMIYYYDTSVATDRNRAQVMSRFIKQLISNISDADAFSLLLRCPTTILADVGDTLITRLINNNTNTKPHPKCIEMLNKWACEAETYDVKRISCNKKLCKKYTTAIGRDRCAEWDIAIPGTKLAIANLADCIRFARCVCRYSNYSQKFKEVYKKLQRNPGWKDRTKEDMTNILLALNSDDSRIKQRLIEIDLVFSDPILPNKIHLSTEANSMFVICMFASKPEYITVDDSVLVEMFSDDDTAKNTVLHLGNIINERPACIHRFEIMYPKMVELCIRRAISCRNKKSSLDTSIVWRLITVLLRDTTAVFPVDVKLRCNCCTEELRKRIQERSINKK